MNATSVNQNQTALDEQMEYYLKDGGILELKGNNIKVKVLFKKITRNEKVFNIYVDDAIHHSGKQFNTMTKKLKRLISRNNLVKC